MVKIQAHRFIASVLVAAVVLNTEAAGAAAWSPTTPSQGTSVATFRKEALMLHLISMPLFSRPGVMLGALWLFMTGGLSAQTNPTNVEAASSSLAQPASTLSDSQLFSDTVDRFVDDLYQLSLLSVGGKRAAGTDKSTIETLLLRVKTEQDELHRLYQVRMIRVNYRIYSLTEFETAKNAEERYYRALRISHNIIVHAQESFGTIRPGMTPLENDAVRYGGWMISGVPPIFHLRFGPALAEVAIKVDQLATTNPLKEEKRQSLIEEINQSIESLAKAQMSRELSERWLSEQKPKSWRLVKHQLTNRKRIARRTLLGGLWTAGALGFLFKSPALAQQEEASSGQDQRKAAAEAFMHANELAQELDEALTQYLQELEVAIKTYDRGTRTVRGQKIPGADIGVGGGRADVTEAALQKFFGVRMLASGEPGEALAALRKLEKVILEAPNRLDADEATMRRRLRVSAKDPDPISLEEWKQMDHRWKSARADIQKKLEAARTALPLTLLDQASDVGWTLLIRGGPDWLPRREGEKTDEKDPPKRSQTIDIPEKMPRAERLVLVNTPSYRAALSDGGTDLRTGRRVFFQEEWKRVQERGSQSQVEWTFKRVTVDPISGQHTLSRPYPLVTFQGSDIENVYELGKERYYLRYLNPPEESEEPARDEVESALAEVTNTRHDLQSLVDAVRKDTLGQLATNDVRLVQSQKDKLDDGLPVKARCDLFAIRGAVAGVAAIRENVNRIQGVWRLAYRSVDHLEELATWANRATLENPTHLPAREWDRLQSKATEEIDRMRRTQSDPLASLPLGLSENWVRVDRPSDPFIIRIRRASWPGSSGSVELLQEVWAPDTSVGVGALQGELRIVRTNSRILIDPQTGFQSRTEKKMFRYDEEDGDSLEEIFKQFSGENLMALSAAREKWLSARLGPFVAFMLPLLALVLLVMPASLPGQTPLGVHSQEAPIDWSRYESVQKFQPADVDQLTQDIQNFIHRNGLPDAEVDVRFEPIPMTRQYEWLDGSAPCQIQRTKTGYMLFMDPDFWFNPRIKHRFTQHHIEWILWHELIHIMQLSGSPDVGRKSIAAIQQAELPLTEEMARVLNDLGKVVWELDAVARAYEAYGRIFGEPSDSVRGDLRASEPQYRQRFETLLARLSPEARTLFQLELEKAGGLRVFIEGPGRRLRLETWDLTSSWPKILTPTATNAVLVLSELFWKMPSDLYSEKGRQSFKQWLKAAQSSPPEVVVNFFTGILMNHMNPRDARLAAAWTLMKDPYFGAALKSESGAIARRLVLERFDGQARLRKTPLETFNAMVEVMAVAKIPEFDNALRTFKKEPVADGDEEFESRHRLVTAALIDREAGVRTSGRRLELTSAYENKSLIDLFHLSAAARSHSDAEGWDVLNGMIARRIKDPEQLQRLAAALQKAVESSLLPALKPPDVRLLVSLPEWVFRQVGDPDMYEAVGKVLEFLEDAAVAKKNLKVKMPKTNQPAWLLAALRKLEAAEERLPVGYPYRVLLNKQVQVIRRILGPEANKLIRWGDLDAPRGPSAFPRAA